MARVPRVRWRGPEQLSSIDPARPIILEGVEMQHSETGLTPEVLEMELSSRPMAVEPDRLLLQRQEASCLGENVP